MKALASDLGVRIPEVLRKLDNFGVHQGAAYLGNNAKKAVKDFLTRKEEEHALTHEELALLVVAGAEALRSVVTE